MLMLLLAWMLQGGPGGQAQARLDPAVLDNAYVRVTRNAAPCAVATTPGCGDRVLVALGDVTLDARGKQTRMVRGDISVFRAGESYAASPAGLFFEVNLKPDRPPVQSPKEMIPPEKNAILYDGDRFFVFEERLEPGDTRARHSHSQRVVMHLNKTRLQQWPDGQPEIFVDINPDGAGFNPSVIHVVKNVGDRPLRGIIVEFKPERRR